MPLMSFIALIYTIPCAFLALSVLLRKKNHLHFVWGLLNVVLVVSGASLFCVGYAQNEKQALIAWKFSHVCFMLIPAIFYHVVYIFLGLKRKWVLFLVYIQTILLVIIIAFTSYAITNIRFLFNSIYFNTYTPFYCSMFILWSLIPYLALRELFLFIKVEHGLKSIQAKYLMIGAILGFSGGASTVLPAFGIMIYPVGQLGVGLYALISGYAILKYQLMDIKIAVTNAGIFIGVYALVLGAPFYLFAIGFKFIALVVMLVLASAGPFILFYLQRRAGDRLLQEQRRYQTTLRQASAGMGKIKDLNKLLNMIVYVLTHAIQMEHAVVYMYDDNQKKYILGASKRKSGHNQFVESIEKESPLIRYILEKKNPIIFEEIKQKAQDFNDPQLNQIEQIIASLDGELIVPVFIDQDIIAFIVMGKKESGKSYVEDDLAVFSILANQTALAIENAQFYEKMKLTHEQLFQAEKMATIGTMADGLSHQINNRFHALGFIAGDALDTIQMNQKEFSPDKMKEVLAELERAFVRVQDNVVQGGEIVQGLLKYTRKGEAGFTAVDVDAVLKSALEMVQFKIKTSELKIVREYDPVTAPKIKGNFTQLQEVFFNLIDNGYDSMIQRKNELKEALYQPTLIVRILNKDNEAEIIFEDNGMGVKDEDMSKLFTPFFTTKLSSKKGTGLGLYVIKKIIEDNHTGQVEMISKYMQGTQMKLTLPIAIG